MDTRETIGTALIAIGTFSMTRQILGSRMGRMGQGEEETAFRKAVSRFGLAVVTGMGIGVGGIILTWIIGPALTRRMKE